MEAKISRRTYVRAAVRIWWTTIWMDDLMTAMRLRRLAGDYLRRAFRLPRPMLAKAFRARKSPMIA